MSPCNKEARAFQARRRKALHRAWLLGYRFRLPAAVGFAEMSRLSELGDTVCRSLLEKYELYEREPYVNKAANLLLESKLAAMSGIVTAANSTAEDSLQ